MSADVIVTFQGLRADGKRWRVHLDGCRADPQQRHMLLLPLFPRPGNQSSERLDNESKVILVRSGKDRWQFSPSHCKACAHHGPSGAGAFGCTLLPLKRDPQACVLGWRMGIDIDWISTLHCNRQFTCNRPIETGITDFILCVKNLSLREVK